MKNEIRVKFGKRKALIFVVLFATLTFLSVGCASAATTRYVNLGESIQAAVNVAELGDTIIVRDGTYTENVDVNVDHLTIQSENGSDKTIVQAVNSSDNVFEVSADYVNICGFTVEGAAGSGWYYASLYLDGADYCNICNNTVSNNYGNGIFLYYSNNNTLMNNNASNNYGNGIHLYYSSNNTLMNNKASNNDYGICLYSSSNSTLFNNIMSRNNYNFRVLDKYIQNIDMSNEVDGKTVYYWVNQQNQQIPNDAGFVGIINSTNIMVRDLELTNNGEGVLFAYTKNSIIENVTTSNNSCGIYLDTSSHITIKGNNASNNRQCGIYIDDSSNYNTLTNNTASDNNQGIYMKESSNNNITNCSALNNWKGIILIHSSNNKIINSTTNMNSYGIYLQGASNNNEITNNIANSNSKYGIYSTSGAWYRPSNNHITNNIASNNDKGICLESSSKNYVTNNIANLNEVGILLLGSDNTVITNNIANSNDYGIEIVMSSNNILNYSSAGSNGIRGIIITGNEKDDYNNIVDTTNKVNGKAIYYYFDKQNQILDGFDTTHITLAYCSGFTIKNSNVSNGDGITMWNSSNNTITDNIVSNNGDSISLRFSTSNLIANNNISESWSGIELLSAFNNTLTNNDVSNNKYGIYTKSSDDSTITNNTVHSNTDYGIYLTVSRGNLIYNNYFNNTNNAYDHSNNVWNVTKTSGMNIIGNAYLGGNSWCDYTGIDTNGDGIGDTLLPYNSAGMIRNGGDRLPLVQVGFGAPIIKTYAPLSPVKDIKGAERTFSVTVNQKVDVCWQINGKDVQSNTSVTEASYTNTSAAIGTCNVSAIVSTINGTNMQTWVWKVASERPVHNNNTGKNFSTIQAAIDDADTEEGNTIIVDDWIYNENVVVNKSLILKGIDMPIVAAEGYESAFTLSANGTRLEGFEAINSGSGITVHSNNNTITGNIALNNNNGIYLECSCNNSITANTACNNKNGIFLNGSCNNTITEINASKNNYHGIYLRYSCNNNITNNNASSNNNGIYLYGSCNNTITNNNASSSNSGIYLYGSCSNNTITNNNASSNIYGIFLSSSSNNTIYNNYFNNAYNARDLGNNIWNVTKTAGTNIIGGSYLGGNYWSDYTGEDLGEDGFGDTLLPYNSSGSIQSGGDWLPLVKTGREPYTKTDVGVTSNITPASPTDLAAYLPPEYKDMDISDSVVLNVNVTDITPDTTDAAYTDITINVGSMDIETCKVFKTGIGFLPEVEDVTTLPTLSGDPAFSRDLDNKTVTVRLYVGDPLLGVIPAAVEPLGFDTGEGTYPSIRGTHNGTIIPSRDINISKLYTYPCAGTGGHSESIKMYKNVTLIANGSWVGYEGDWHNITIDNDTGASYAMLLKNHMYNYTIVTGSYPQIIHSTSKEVTGGTITCTSFVDVNGKVYYDWIPAIRLE